MKSSQTPTGDVREGGPPPAASRGRGKSAQQDPSGEIRLNKFLAERIGVSRREADKLIEDGKITINGRIAKIGDKIALPTKREKMKFNSFSEQGREDKVFEENLDKNSEVCYNGKYIPFETDYTYIAFNKPVGYVCSRRAQGKAPTLYDLLPKDYQKLKTVGRLDKDSSGLILLTNDGDFAFQMTHPKFHKEKIYEVELDQPLEPLHQQMISDYGIVLDDGISKFTIIKGALETFSFGPRPAGPSPRAAGASPRAAALRNPSGEDSKALYTAILSEGRNRQIRRTFAALGYNVVNLHRTSFGPFQLGSLKSGQYQLINKKEIGIHF